MQHYHQLLQHYRHHHHCKLKEKYNKVIKQRI